MKTSESIASEISEKLKVPLAKSNSRLAVDGLGEIIAQTEVHRR